MIMGLHKNKAIDNHGNHGKPSNDGTMNYWITMINSLAISGTDSLEVPTISKAYFFGLNFR